MVATTKQTCGPGQQCMWRTDGWMINDESAFNFLNKDKAIERQAYIKSQERDKITLLQG